MLVVSVVVVWMVEGGVEDCRLEGRNCWSKRKLAPEPSQFSGLDASHQHHKLYTPWHRILPRMVGKTKCLVLLQAW
jgi:hypothetical protein